jgi:L-ascorbate metabolism protein UlaG (beta-lactamase superfamily)
VAIFDMGSNAPGATDKSPPYDCARLGETIGAKLLIPDHYDNWANTAGDPELLSIIYQDCGREHTAHQDHDHEMRRPLRLSEGSGQEEIPLSRRQRAYDFSKSVFAKK